MPLSQRNRSLTVQTPLGSDVFIIRKLSGTEELSRPFHFVLELISDRVDISPEEILGKNLTVGLKLPTGGVRTINGVVTRFNRGGLEDSGLRSYQAAIQPWFGLLTHSSNCRIFQNMDVPAIIGSVFTEHGFSDFEHSLTRSYGPREFCVQYRETDFGFLNRLMEEEGIFYYFKQDGDKHIMVLSDSNQSASSIPGYETIPFSARQDATKETIYDWNTSQELLPGVFTLDDYNFTEPQTQLLASASASTGIPLMENFELYDYPGKYRSQAEGQVYSETRMQELEAQSQLIRGVSNAKGLTVGSRFRIKDHDVASENEKDYFLLSTTHSIEQDYQPSVRITPLSYLCMFVASPMDIAYHPPRHTPKPIIHGPQTGIVVGPAGEEIHTDEYGRVKVQFHWDRIGNVDDKSSCWLRVSQIWAGNGWGGFYLPRVGQEVVIEFLEGDPDWPLITGSVYNADQQPPYALPDHKTRSGIKSRSSKYSDRNQANEVRFEDKTGEEQLYIRAQKDLEIEILNDKNEAVGSAMSGAVGSNRTVTVGASDSLSVGQNRTVEVAADDSLSVSQNRTAAVAANDNLTVGKSLTIVAGGKITVSIGASSITLTRTGIVIKGKTITLQGQRSLEL